MVLIKNVTKMFWGVTIDAGKRYSQVVNDGFHLSMAAMEQNPGSSDHVQVMLQHESSEFLLCTLQHGKLLQQPLDLVFTAGEEVSFSLNGKGVVHLTGYLLNDEPEMEDIEEESDSDTPDLVDASQLAGKKRKALAIPSKSKRAKVLINDVDEEEDDDDDDEEDDEDEEDMDDEFSEDDLSIDLDDDDEEDDDDDEDEDSENEVEERTPKGKGKNPTKSPLQTPSGGTPGKTKKDAATPTSNTKKQQQPTSEAKQGKAKQTPGGTPESGKKNNTEQTPSTTPATPANGESKKKRKRNKKKKKDGDDSVNASANSTPSSTPKSESQPKVEVTPKKRVVAGGTVVEDVKVGHGPEAKPGKMVSVYYVGTLAKNNKRFDSCTEGKPFRFRLSQGEVIKGWDNGLNGMKVGGKRKITVPANQAYGNVRQGPIPPNSSLIFEVELKAIS